MKFTNFDSRDVVESTMDIAREAVSAKDLDACGTVVMAEFQTKGRGRQGRAWFAPHGANVCMTAIGWAWPANGAWVMALMAGIASAEAIGALTGLPVKVRFPNDVYLGCKKLGGILVETAPSGKLGSVIPLIGIGINVNVPLEAFPEEIAERATSILAETGDDFAVGTLAGNILNCLGDMWDLASTGPIEDTILPRWRELALPENVRTFHIDGRATVCTINDINAHGMVEITTADGEDHMIHATQIILGDD